jgi:pterin-4a-carbinolamine dehydratase
MANAKNDETGWTERDRPASLSKRFIFVSYAENRDFLDRVADLSEETGIHPDISFGRDYANLTVNPLEGDVLTEAERDFAQRVDAIVGSGG